MHVPLILNKMKIRLATPSDLPAINEIYNQAVRKRYCTADLDEIDMQSRIEWFEGHVPEKYPVFVGELDGIIIGWICFSPYRSGRRALNISAEVSYYLHEDYLQKGYGSILFMHAIEVAPSFQFKNVFAILLEPNIASIKLLEKFQFKRWALLPDIAMIDGKECSQVYYGRSV